MTATSTSDAAVADAVAVLRRGGLVAFPTETVYGLGADAANPDALRRLYAVKGRPSTHPVIVHLATGRPEVLTPWVQSLSPAARALADTYWPGPLTLVLRRAAGVPDEVTGGSDTVGVRVPDQPVARRLLTAFGGGVAAPSANRFGRVSPTTAAHVRADLGDEVDLVLDGGACRVGLESTVVDCTGDDPLILRHGALTREQIEAVAGRPVALRTDGTRVAPGTLATHYAPTAEVELVAGHEVERRAAQLVAAGRRVGVISQQRDVVLPDGAERLDTPGDIDGFAHELYALLRDADGRGLDVVLAVPPAAEGIGAAVVDRLTRAAGPSAGKRAR